MRMHEYKIIQNDLMVKLIQTRKQTRKFKNKRWNKKYWKKYTKLVPMTDVYISEIDKTIVCHPSVYEEICKIYKNPTERKPRDIDTINTNKHKRTEPFCIGRSADSIVYDELLDAYQPRLLSSFYTVHNHTPI